MSSFIKMFYFCRVPALLLRVYAISIHSYFLFFISFTFFPLILSYFLFYIISYERTHKTIHGSTHECTHKCTQQRQNQQIFRFFSISCALPHSLKLKLSTWLIIICSVARTAFNTPDWFFLFSHDSFNDDSHFKKYSEIIHLKKKEKKKEKQTFDSSGNGCVQKSFD